MGWRPFQCRQSVLLGDREKLNLAGENLQLVQGRDVRQGQRGALAPACQGPLPSQGGSNVQ